MHIPPNACKMQIMAEIRRPVGHIYQEILRCTQYEQERKKKTPWSYFYHLTFCK